jgi:hypothetical protein
MPTPFTKELRDAGVSYSGYRELAQPIQDAQGASRWPLLSATDQVLVAQRWKRKASHTAPVSNVTALSSRQPELAHDWFGAAAQPKSATR